MEKLFNCGSKTILPCDEKHLATNNLLGKTILITDKTPSYLASSELKDINIRAWFQSAKVILLSTSRARHPFKPLKKSIGATFLALISATHQPHNHLKVVLKQRWHAKWNKMVCKGLEKIWSISLVQPWTILFYHKATVEYKESTVKW